MLMWNNIKLSDYLAVFRLSTSLITREYSGYEDHLESSIHVWNDDSNILSYYILNIYSICQNVLATFIFLANLQRL